VNTESVQCRKVAFGTGMEKPGDFCFDESRTTLYVWYPETSAPDAIAISRSPSCDSRVWLWDGNEDAPSLYPSLGSWTWHGWLNAGKLTSC